MFNSPAGVPGVTAQIPPLQTSCFSPNKPELIRETAAQLVLLNVHWAKTLPAFQAMSLDDQANLIAKSWKELFILGELEKENLASY